MSAHKKPVELSSKTCGCGCGQFPRAGSKYVQHHWSTSQEGREAIKKSLTGRPVRPESIEKFRQKRLGHPVSQETREKIRQSLLGKALSPERVEELRSRTASEDTRKKMSEISKKRWREHRDTMKNTWSLRGNSKHTEETKARMSATQKAIANTPEARAAKSARMMGNVVSAETRKKIKATLKARFANIDPSTLPTWKGGVFTEYPKAWREAKAAIRHRDDNRCMMCGTKDFSRTILRRPDCHHIDGIKENIRPDNLICLCRSCHILSQRHMDESRFGLRAILTARYGYVYD